MGGGGGGGAGEGDGGGEGGAGQRPRHDTRVLQRGRAVLRFRLKL